MARNNLHESQKPRLGLVITLIALITMGAGCEDAGNRLASGLSAVQAKIDDVKTTVETWKGNYDKAKAIYDILNSDAAPTADTPQPTPDVPTPSAPTSEDQQLPAAEENISSP